MEKTDKKVQTACSCSGGGLGRILPGLVIIGVVLAGCVNEKSTGVLTSAEIEAKQVSHEQRYVAGKCNSANRLNSSNIASAALNAIYSSYSENESSIDAGQKDKIVADLKAHGAELQSLDQNLNAQCVTYSTCEFQASTTKQGCSSEKHKFLEAQKQMTKFGERIKKTRIN